MSHVPKNSEPIPGYAVKDRIGVGGYGEVWSAQAPGGLTKAIKFVYGYFDDARATRELKALDRIKQVRHPFLLSLERFEIVDGQLIIVTELADMSLKDRFEQVKKSGDPGVPRDELLRYIRDAADALDYMNESYSLQHLDVKPENLLLVGGHVKVADFGLVKDLQHDATASMMGGLTPIYAAPEVFDDRPSQRSDQYSLAIVYQEMLTGNLPFPGRTPAQLASQHLHASPRLSGLPLDDQVVISRALSKDPAARFPNCRAMVDALLGQAPSGGWSETSDRRANSDTTSIKSASSKTDADGTHRQAGRPARRTEVLGNEPPALSESRCAASLALKGVVEPIVDLGPLDLEDLGCELRPTLFLGIGGTAGRVLRKLRRRFKDRFGAADHVPAMRMLLLDTDAKYLYQVTEGERDSALADRDTLALPLRGAQDYTSDGRNILGWLSRRWLYNIPRSLQTEGRRPLGRLALVDHAPRVIDGFRAALTEVISPEALAASAEATGQAFDAQAPRIFLVASISGGTGGGMVLDVAYAIRKVLTDLGLSAEGLCAVLTHSTDRNTSAAELATANAYACLKELQHYRESGYSPGDPACGLPASESDGALPNVYFVPLGYDLNEPEYDAATDKLAGYLYLNSVTKAGSAFDRCRALTSQEEAGVSVRGFGTASIGSLQTDLPALASELLCQEVVDHWRGTGHERPGRNAPPSLFPPPASVAANLPTPEQQCQDLGLDVTNLRGQISTVLEKELGGDAEAIYARLKSKVQSQSQAAPTVQAGRLLQALRDLFDPPTTGEDGLKIPLPASHVAIERGLKQLANPKGEALRDFILSIVDNPEGRVGWAAKARDAVAARLRSVEGEASELLKETQQNIQGLEQSILTVERTAPSRSRMFGARRAERKQAAELEGMLLLAVRLRLQAFTIHGVVKLVRLISAGVTSAGDQIKDLQRELRQWSDQFEADFPWDDEEAPPPENILAEIEETLAEQLQTRFAELAQRIDARVQEEFLSTHRGLRSICQRADAMRPAMLAALRNVARSEVLAALKGTALSAAVLGPSDDAESQVLRLTACQDIARPALVDCAGSQRLFAIVPEGDANQPLRDALGSLLDPPPTILADSDADLTLCYEQQALSLPHVAARLIADRDDYTQIAARLHTRSDIDWTELPTPGQKPASAKPVANVLAPAPANPMAAMTQPANQ